MRKYIADEMNHLSILSLWDLRGFAEEEDSVGSLRDEGLEWDVFQLQAFFVADDCVGIGTAQEGNGEGI